MMNYWYYGPHFSWFGGLLSLVWWAFLIWLFISLFKHLFGGKCCQHHSDMTSKDASDEALKILKSRYAKGEITKKEFDSIKKDIA